MLCQGTKIIISADKIFMYSKKMGTVYWNENFSISVNIFIFAK